MTARKKRVDDVANEKPRYVQIRERLDASRARGFGFYPAQDLVSDMEWLLSEHKRMRRERALDKLANLPDPTPVGRLKP